MSEKSAKSLQNLRLDYLQWRGCPKAFYILKKEKLDGPIEDIATSTKKMNEEERNFSKPCIYSYMTHVQNGDKTRNVRELVKSAKKNTPLFNVFKKEIEKPEIMLTMAELNNPPAPKTPEESAELDLKRKNIETKLNRAFETAKIIEQKDLCEPIDRLERANAELALITTWDISSLSDKREEFLSRLDELEKTLEGIKHAAGK